jgi:hypothetical protein
MPFPPTDPVAYLHGLWHTVPLAVGVTVVLTSKRKTTVRTELESGAWIEHVPVQDLKGKHIRDYARVAKMRMTRDDVDDDGEVDVGGLVERMDVADMDEARHDALWAMLITAWSFPFPVPQFDRASGTVAGAEVLEDIGADDYEEIDRILDPHAKKLRRRPSPKKATTTASNGSSRANHAGSRRG